MTDDLRLSDEQQTIVAQPLAPTRIAAGAGTGKTTTIAWRLAAAVRNEGIDPEAALGITFTNKAADELADRLRVTLPELAAEGREVEVTTYHGFAHRLLEEFGVYVGVEREVAIIGPGYTRQLMAEALGEATLDVLDLTAPAHRINEAAALARQLGDNLLTPDDLLAAAPDHPDEVWGKRQELAEILRGYQAAKHRLGVVDYGDLIHNAHRLVNTQAGIAERIRRRYGIVLLDEYQDTDPAQRELLRILFGDGFPIMSVGDPNQTIYEWRGASLENFAAFPTHFPSHDGVPARTLPLTLNRRSGTTVLALANRIRGEIDGAASEQDLRATAEAPQGKVEARYFRTAWDEASWIASEIRRIHDDEGRPWHTIALLFRKNRNIPMLRDALDSEGIPLEVVSLGGLLAVPEVADLHAWLRILHDPADSAALARVLLGAKYRLGLGDLAPLARSVRAARKATQLPEEAPGWQLLEAIDRLEDVEGIPAEAHARLETFRTLYRDLLVAAQSSSLVEICRRVLDGLGAWAEVDAMEHSSGLSARLNLYRFLDLAEDWSPLQERPSLEAFLGYLEVLLSEDDTEELDTARVSAEDAVSLLTVHRAKGLEWETVFVPAIARDTFPTRPLGFDDPITKPYSLPYELRIDAASLPDLTGTEEERREALRARHRDQEWRIAYVAVTRAKRQVYLSGAWWYTARRPQPPSPLFDLACEVDEVEVALRVDEPGPAPERATPILDPVAPDPLFADGWRTALRRAGTDPAWLGEAFDLGPAYQEAFQQMTLSVEQLPASPVLEGEERFSTSVTSLVTVARCPKQYYWSEVDHLPRRPDLGRKRGTDFHRRVELHNLGVVALPEADPHDIELGESSPGDDRSPWDVYLDSRFAGSRPRFVEVPIAVDLDSGSIRGRIDAVYEEVPGAWEIVDYKSGRRHDDPARSVQLEAYAVAAADGAIAMPGPERLRVTFAYFGSGEVEEESEAVDEGWLAAARSHLEELLAVAAEGPHEAAPSKACGGCDFLSFCAVGEAYLATTSRS